MTYPRHQGLVLGAAVAAALVLAGLALRAAPTAARPLEPGPGASAAALAPLSHTAPMTTATPSATPTITHTATATPDVLATAVAATLTAMAPTITPTRPPPTQPPRPAYLPVTLRDQPCKPEASYSDLVFVQDVSHYMGNIRDGREAGEWATHYMKRMVDLVDMTRARVALVRFTDQTWVEQPLTNNRGLVLAAIDKAPHRSADKSRMDQGLRVARDQLVSRAATRGNKKVIVFISELQAKAVPWENVPGCVEKRGEECAVLAAAREVKGQDITIYVWATSNANDGGQMLWADLATDRSKRYLLPSDADIAKTFGELQVVKPCPPELFWPFP